jgi:hypothetical protein
METCNQSIEFVMQTYSENLTYNDINVLSFTIIYPEITQNNRVDGRLNEIINSQIKAYYNKAKRELYRAAVEGYLDAQKNGFPFNEYNMTVEYAVTYNQNCAFSFYRDAYTYTGGAHGSTVRLSDTFSLLSGRKLSLGDFFTNKEYWKFAVLSAILKQADETQNASQIYFENYRELILRTYNPESFYLTPDGIAVYFQQYDIAPYSTGMPVFVLPYSEIGATEPSCGIKT